MSASKKRSLSSKAAVDRPPVVDRRSSSLDIALGPQWRRHREGRIAAALTGDVDAVRELFGLAAAAMRAGAPLPVELGEWLCLMLDTDTAAPALLHAAGRSKRGRPRVANRDDALVARLVWHARALSAGQDSLAAAKQALLDELALVDLDLVPSQLDKIVANRSRIHIGALFALSIEELEVLAQDALLPSTR